MYLSRNRLFIHCRQLLYCLRVGNVLTYKGVLPTFTAYDEWQFWNLQFLHMQALYLRFKFTTELISHKESILWNRCLGSLKLKNLGSVSHIVHWHLTRPVAVRTKPSFCFRPVLFSQPELLLSLRVLCHGLAGDGSHHFWGKRKPSWNHYLVCGCCYITVDPEMSIREKKIQVVLAFPSQEKQYYSEPDKKT